MDTRMIEVGIGLAMVFALVSLLVTALQEAVTSMLSRRGRNLQKAIVSFVGDDAGFAQALLRHPLIVSLAAGARDETRRPSYMSADIVVTSLVSQMVDAHMGGVRPGTPGEWIGAVKAASAAGGGAAAAALPNREFVRSLASLAQGVENDWPAYEARIVAWYDAVGERSIGWFKRTTQMWLFGLGFLVAAAANINPIVITSSLWNDEPLRKAVVGAAETVSQNYAKAQAPVAAPTPSTTAASGAPARVATAAAASAPRLPALLSPLPRPLRVAQAAAVETHMANLDAALFAALEQLKTHPADGAWQSAQRAANDVIELRELIDKRRLPDDGSTTLLRVHSVADAGIDRRLAEIAALLPADTSHSLARQHLHSLQVAIAAERKGLADRSAALDPHCTKLDDPAARELCLRLNDLSALQGIGLPIGWSPAVLPRVFPEGCDAADAADKPASAECRAATPFSRGIGGLGNWLLAFIGWGITAIAVTLGAPFWFDTLGRLVNLRGSGARPTDSAAEGTATATTTGGGTLARQAPAAPGAEREAMSDALNAAEKALAATEVERLQRGLHLAETQVSGNFDAATRQAIIAWQRERGLAATGELTADQIQQLLRLGPETAKDEDGYFG